MKVPFANNVVPMRGDQPAEPPPSPAFLAMAAAAIHNSRMAQQPKADDDRSDK